jgi:cellulose synthase (UDP-forming)
MVRVIWLLTQSGAVGLAVLLFWLVRNTYYLIMAIFLVDGRDSDGEPVRVIDAEPVEVRISHHDGSQRTYEGVATLLTEHSMRVFLDFANDVKLGERAWVRIDTGRYHAELTGSVVGLLESRTGDATVHTIEILDYGTSELEYLQILYDRIPTLPQSLSHDWGTLEHLWRNIAFRVARTVR